ncbi:uncharacterized protein LOC124302027 [Neodiprion virginianus]|uniref:uncharacterized protein LOC124302027 n=1 Tax=Neodiprion virginianus TaxID=2961670 RepID=UPI001EE74956|nr:uncharacterized protein LOC124302027 [Neodiprion virginianus]
MALRRLFFLAWLAVFAVKTIQECFDDGVEFCVNSEDILATDLLPDSFLFADQKPQHIQNYTGSRRAYNNGTISEAFNAMGFHRKKMNEYLCHGFLAEKILTAFGGSRVKRRLDISSENSYVDYVDDNNVSIHEKMLSDEGSSKYKDWLTKTTTLDDIYRHYSPRPRDPKIKKKQFADRQYDNEEEDEYDGAVTGFAMPAPISTGKIGSFDPSGPDEYSSAATHHFHHSDYIDHHFDPYPQVHEEHIYVPNHHESYHHHDHHRPSYHHHGKGKGHDLSLKDFFEIALTALAFLAFGLFIIQLMVNVTNSATATAATFLQADIDGTRFKRESSPPVSPPLLYAGNVELNELSHRVLRSIEAVLIAEEDGGNCLRRALCEDNRYSRETTGGRRIWSPVWSLGMSWVSGRMTRKTPWSAMLSSVKAAVLGLGGADCAILFSDCHLEQEVAKMRRRRRRRK